MLDLPGADQRDFLEISITRPEWMDHGGNPSAITIRAGNEPSRARLGSARFGSVVQRAEPGLARQFHEPIEEARLGSLSARELARVGSRANAAHCITEQFL